jgi:hypothetical protein
MLLFRLSSANLVGRCGTGLAIGSNIQPIAQLHLQPRDRSARQLQDAPHLEAHRSQPVWRQAAPQLDYPKIAVQTHHIDFERHEKSMNTGRGSNPQPPSSVQTASPEETKQPLQGCIGQFDPITHYAAPSCIDHSEHWNRTAPPFLCYLLLGLLLPAVDNDSQYDECQHSSHNSNDNR